MKIKLNSDFTDYYDHHFCNSHEQHDVVLNRRMSAGPNRIKAFKLLKKAGFETPLNDYVPNLINKLTDKFSNDPLMLNLASIVVYYDLTAHAGEGKEKISLEEASKPKYKNLYASEFIPNTPSGMGLAYRVLIVGSLGFAFIYSSSNDWRSNCGDVTVTLNYRFSVDRLKHQVLNDYPIYAIDFVVMDDKYLAIDFNVSPGLKGTGIENILNPSEVYQEIHSYYCQTSRTPECCE